MIFRVGAERSRRRSVHKVHDCDENREGNNPENSAVKGIEPWNHSKTLMTSRSRGWALLQRITTHSILTTPSLIIA
ncbi:MAG: hypothetical protein U1E78_10620 [Gammaproteobacteria bacterium]